MERFNDSVVQSRIDKRVLATASMWYVKNGRLPRTVSELVRYVIEDYVRVLVSNEKIELITESESARQVLAELYRSRAFNAGGKGVKNEYSNLLLDDIERNPKLLANEEYARVNDNLMKQIRLGMRGVTTNIEQAKKENLARVTYDENRVCNNKFVETKIEKPEDWDKDNKPKMSKEEKERLINEAVEQLKKKLESENVIDEEPEVYDVKDSWTHKKMTSEELKKKEEERRKKDEEQNRLMDEFDPRTCAIKEGDI